MDAHEPTPTAVQIIDLFGGPTQLASALGIKPSAVNMWRSNGIPARWWLPIERLATIEPETRHVTAELLERHKP
jgi:DNA-binding transcriptional regulator YdaS (Cro superfamily)